jgi:hypothetical protein
VDRTDERRREGRLSHDEFEDLVQAVWDRLQLQVSKIAFRVAALIIGSSGFMAFAWDFIKAALKTAAAK